MPPCAREQVKRKKAAILALRDTDKEKAKKEGALALLPLLDEEPGLSVLLNHISPKCQSRQYVVHQTELHDVQQRVLMMGIVNAKPACNVLHPLLPQAPFWETERSTT